MNEEFATVPVKATKVRYAKRLALVLDSIAIAFCLFAFLLDPNPAAMIPIAVYALPIGAIVAPQKEAFDAAAIILCVIVGILGIVASVYMLFSDGWGDAWAGKYAITAVVFVFVGLAPLLSAQVIRFQEWPGRPNS